MEHKIYFPQFKKDAKIIKGKSILEYAKEQDTPISSSCGGMGICKECRISIEKGSNALNERTVLEENLDGKERLACQTIIIDDSTDVFIKALLYGLLRKIAVKGKRKKIKLNPLTRKKYNNVVFNNKIIDIYRGNIYGIAADIGTTTIVLHLLDLESGVGMSTSALENPQRLIDGNNVISRIEYDKKRPNKLHKELILRINDEIKKMPCDAQEVYEMAVVGNSTMRDIFFDLDVQKLGIKPFKSLTELKREQTFLNKKGVDLSLGINKDANVYGAPLIGSHVGSDSTAVCLSTDLFNDSNMVIMAIDIGTNGEIILKYGKKIIATSCAAGPAFEPVPALEGAIHWIRLDEGNINLKTIGNVKPIGICGSGIIDLLVELLKNNKMDENGYLLDGRIFKITEGIHLTQDYIKGENGLMWSKAAISLGIKALLEKAKVGTDDIDRVYLTGSFGTYINKENARRIGLLPDVPLKKIIQVGNAASEGAKEMLLSKERRKLSEKGADEVEVIALELIPNYGNRLMLEEQNFNNLRIYK